MFQQQMSVYCTFFDHGYLAQGLALWDSLRRHEPDAVLVVLALDADTDAILRAIAPPALQLLSLDGLLAADPQLAAARVNRDRREFAYTVKPCLCRYLVPQGEPGAVVVYLDSDLYFFGSPRVIQHEMGDHSVLIVPHRYPAWHDGSREYGRFNAGLLAFRNDAAGCACLEHWRMRCLDSCALLAGGASYGDQKYLDEWPARFGASAKISENSGLNLAPWNWARHRCEVLPEAVMVDGVPLVVFHYARFRQISVRWFDSGQLEYGIMPLRLRSRLYGEYWSALQKAENLVRSVRPDYALSRKGWRETMPAWHLALLCIVWGQYWWRLGPWWLAGRFGMGYWAGRVMGPYRQRRRNRK